MTMAAKVPRLAWKLPRDLLQYHKAALCKVYRRSYSSQSPECTAVMLSEFGNPQKVLTMTKSAIPVIEKKSQVLVKMMMAPINPSDLNTIEGTYPVHPSLPSVVGNEGVGVVTDVGSEVKSLRVGDWVLPAEAGWGTWRTHAICEEADVQQIDNDIPALSAATLAVNPCTAYRMLKDYIHLDSGDIVIQNGANSAVGQCVIQIAKEWGLKTVNVIRERPDCEKLVKYLKDLGATHVVTEEFARSRQMKELISSLPSPPKLALNCVGGKSSTELVRYLADNSVMVTYGGMSRQPVIIPTGSLIFKDIRFAGYWNTAWNKRNKLNPEKVRMYNELCDMIRECKLLPPTCDLVRIENFQEAISSAMEGFKGQKKILVMSDDLF